MSNTTTDCPARRRSSTPERASRPNILNRYIRPAVVFTLLLTDRHRLDLSRRGDGLAQVSSLPGQRQPGALVQGQVIGSEQIGQYWTGPSTSTGGPR